MTSVVGIVEDKTVWIGGDSLLSRGPTISPGATKIWKRTAAGSTWIFGGAGIWRNVQLAQYQVPLPECPPGSDLVDYLVTKWIPLYRKVIDDEGRMVKKEGSSGHADTSLLIGLRDQLFTIDPGFCVNPTCPSQPFATIGSGGETTHGYLAALRDVKCDWPVKKRIQMAIREASRSCVGVGGKITILHT